ncbi:hypothetical protein DUNSADRAFT_11019 [Dunaliella salina]|uniref:C-factor n=1 Tax=Dunaliella salina TaxID=3046 RepID=A0ABQ7GE67_DUNSA|nr:hypothetical protein DUNSADRAFT_11019 [Dunaliella salina]|eukprot:KAF5832907.1 hypothetical protein DUNSADRAFT_11019 [Dunaliella salina]
MGGKLCNEHSENTCFIGESWPPLKTQLAWTNAVGPFLVVQQLLARGLIGSPPAQNLGVSAEKQQQQHGEGCSTLIANISSIVASQGDQEVSSKMGGGYAYRASKAALNIINKALCNDLTASHRVESVLLHPGYVRTDLTGGLGAIDVRESTDGLFAVLTSGKPLNNRFYSYTGEEIPW